MSTISASTLTDAMHPSPAMLTPASNKTQRAFAKRGLRGKQFSGKAAENKKGNMDTIYIRIKPVVEFVRHDSEIAITVEVGDKMLMSDQRVIRQALIDTQMAEESAAVAANQLMDQIVVTIKKFTANYKKAQP